MSKLEQARDPNTSPITLEQLATVEGWKVRTQWVRYNLLQNPNTPHYIKKYLKIQKHLVEL
jgi:hypothetical protein